MAAAAACVGVSAEAAPPPASAFGRVPAVVDAAISPNGQRIAILGGVSDQRVISIATIDQPGLPILQLGDVEGVGVRWAGDDYLLANIAFWEAIGDMRRSYRFERQISITKDAKPAAKLTASGMMGGNQIMLDQPVLRITSGAQPRIMMVGLIDSSGASATQDTRIKRKGEEGGVRALWRIDPVTGQGGLSERGNFDTRSWSVDSTGEPRVRIDIDEINHRFSLYGRPKGKSLWTALVANADFSERRNYLGYQESADAVLLAKDGKIVLRRLADGAVETFAEDADASSLVWDPERGVVVGLAVGRERLAYRWLDPEIGGAHGVLSRAFKDRNVSLYGWSNDRTRFLARVSSPTSPPAWYLYDKARKEVSVLAEEYPELKAVALAPVTFMSYKARDGLEIPAYVTLPPGAAPGAKLPLVVLPHGGPAARDGYGFDFLAQFIASRGYAVLQPQFRGSVGFGRELEAAGRGEWGGKVQTDLLDGVSALAASGRIDASRVCIVGASFGGYSALAGAALHPDAYRCAASINGMSDLSQMINDDVRLYGRDSESVGELRSMLGSASAELLAATSPARHAGKVQAPVLLIHGDKDTVVQPSQSRLMAERLRAAGKPHELIILEGENHYLARAVHRTRTLEALEAFLAKHLPAN